MCFNSVESTSMRPPRKTATRNYTEWLLCACTMWFSNKANDCGGAHKQISNKLQTSAQARYFQIGFYQRRSYVLA